MKHTLTTTWIALSSHGAPCCGLSLLPWLPSGDVGGGERASGAALAPTTPAPCSLQYFEFGRHEQALLSLCMPQPAGAS